MSSRIDAVMDAAIENQSIVGAELVVARHGDIVYRRTPAGSTARPACR